MPFLYLVEKKGSIIWSPNCLQMIFNGLHIQIFNAFQISLMGNIDLEPFCSIAVFKYLVKTLEEYLHWLKNSCSPFNCCRRKNISFADIFKGFCLQINKFEKVTAFYFWQYIPYVLVFISRQKVCSKYLRSYCRKGFFPWVV